MTFEQPLTVCTKGITVALKEWWNHVYRGSYFRIAKIGTMKIRMIGEGNRFCSHLCLMQLITMFLRYVKF